MQQTQKTHIRKHNTIMDNVKVNFIIDLGNNDSSDGDCGNSL